MTRRSASAMRPLPVPAATAAALILAAPISHALAGPLGGVKATGARHSLAESARRWSIMTLTN